ncbi:hypothetical protein ACKWTF_004891 [Chironomus riparius]
MAFRNNRRNNQGGNFNNNYGGSISRGNVNPWNNNMDNGPNRGGGNQNEVVGALLNMFRNQGNIPSLIENMGNGFNRGNQGGGGGGGGFNDNFHRGGGGRNMSNNRRNNNNNNNNNNRVVKGAIRKPNVANRKAMANNNKKNSNNSKQNDSATDSTTNTKNTNDARNGKDVKGDINEKEPKRKNSPYSDVPNDMFYCHLCAKHMWDSTSFENHLKGRTHQMMKEGVEESYHLKANMLRQEAKIAEQLKSIEIDRLKRLGKQIRAANQVREYCAMCDLSFYGHLSTHRKTNGHLDLKKFLHPKCDDCNAEFHNRAEYDDHLLSPQHMKTCKTPPSYKSEESRRNRLQILTEADEVQGLREEKPKKEKKEVKEGETAEAADGEKKEENGEPMETEATEEDGKAEEEAEDAEAADKPEIEPILDFKDGDEIGPEIETKIPKYNCKRQVGFSLISKLICFECRLCNKYFDTEGTAEVHSRTFNHHRLFVKFLNEKANETKIAQKRAAAAAAEENERQKRIKLESETEPTAEVVAKPSDELYDPTEATADDDTKEEITDEVMKPVAETVVEKEPTPVEAPKVEEKKPEPVAEPLKEEVATPVVTPATPSTPVATPTPVTPATPTVTPVEKQPETPKANEQPQQQNTPKSQNNTPNKNFNNNNRGGRGGRNNNNQRRSGRYGGRF